MIPMFSAINTTLTTVLVMPKANRDLAENMASVPVACSQIAAFRWGKHAAKRAVIRESIDCRERAQRVGSGGDTG